MDIDAPDFTIQRLGESRIPSPVAGFRFINEQEHVLYHSHLEEVQQFLRCNREPPCMEVAGPRAQIYFDPSKLKCGIVTCGGLCPGLNDVIRAIVMSAHYHSGVRTIFGFPYGYEGLSHRYRHTPLELTPEIKKLIEKRWKEYGL